MQVLDNFLGRAVYNGMDVALKYYPLGDREWAKSQWRNLFALNEWRKEIGTSLFLFLISPLKFIVRF
jgi:hypothetical protein